MFFSGFWNLWAAAVLSSNQQGELLKRFSLSFFFLFLDFPRPLSHNVLHLQWICMAPPPVEKEVVDLAGLRWDNNLVWLCVVFWRVRLDFCECVHAVNDCFLFVSHQFSRCQYFFFLNAQAEIYKRSIQVFNLILVLLKLTVEMSSYLNKRRTNIPTLSNHERSPNWQKSLITNQKRKCDKLDFYYIQPSFTRFHFSVWL